MAIQRTLSIIKPDAVAKNVIGEIISRFEKNNLKIIAAKLITLSASDAGGFYAEHKGKPFYDDLIEFMTSGPVFIQVLEGEDAISKNRELMGNTDPKKRYYREFIEFHLSMPSELLLKSFHLIYWDHL